MLEPEPDDFADPDPHGHPDRHGESDRQPDGLADRHSDGADADGLAGQATVYPGEQGLQGAQPQEHVRRHSGRGLVEGRVALARGHGHDRAGQDRQDQDDVRVRRPLRDSVGRGLRGLRRLRREGPAGLRDQQAGQGQGQEVDDHVVRQRSPVRR